MEGGTFYGVLNVLADEVNTFSDSDQKILELFTIQAAIALENAQLFNSVTLQNDQLRELTAQLSALEEMERKLIADTLKACQGSKAAAARLLGIGRKTIYNKIKKYGLSTTDGSPDLV